jgi:hypothetical protein
MFDQVLDNLRKATDSTIQLQQEMFRQWFQQWPQVLGIPTPGTMLANSWADQVHAFQRKWSQTVTDMLNKHRETLDSQYRAGIRTIEDAFRVAEAKDPAQFRKLTEELWRSSFDCLKTAMEAQLREFQAAAEKAFEAMSKGGEAISKGVPGARV